MRECFYKLRRTTIWLFLFVMPIGVWLDPEHPNELSVGASGGAGQIVTVMRNCSGDIVKSEQSDFQDYGAVAQVSRRIENGDILVLGIRGGHLESDARLLRSDRPGSHFSYDKMLSQGYHNPYFAVEGLSFGFGAGYVAGDLPKTFGLPSRRTQFSGHVRIGNYHETYLLCTHNENLPLASGGGATKIGLGYPAGSRVRLFSGLSFNFYSEPGFVQQMSLPLWDRFVLDLSARLGKTAGKTESGFSVGLQYHYSFENQKNTRRRGSNAETDP